MHFAGKIPHDRVAAYYRRADVFVSASMSETQGMTFIEAMACGLPVLARDRVALSGVLEDGINGYYFTDAEDLAEKLRRMKKQDLRQRQKGSRETAQQYSLENFAEDAEEAYRQAIEEKHGGA